MKFGRSGVRGLAEELLGGGAYNYATDFARYMLPSRGDIIHFRPSGNAPEMRCYVESKIDTGARYPVKGWLGYHTKLG